MKALPLTAITMTMLLGCDAGYNPIKGCYETTSAAWKACNAKYNNKCTYLSEQKYPICSSGNEFQRPNHDSCSDHEDESAYNECIYPDY